MTSPPRPESIIKWWPMLTDETQAEIQAYADACVSNLTKELGESSSALEAVGHPIEWQAKIKALANSGNRHEYTAPPGMVFCGLATIESADRWRYINERNNIWRREDGDNPCSLLCVVLPYGADLSGRAARERAIDVARKA